MAIAAAIFSRFPVSRGGYRLATNRSDESGGVQSSSKLSGPAGGGWAVADRAGVTAENVSSSDCLKQFCVSSSKVTVPEKPDQLNHK